MRFKKDQCNTVKIHQSTNSSVVKYDFSYDGNSIQLSSNESRKFWPADSGATSQTTSRKKYSNGLTEVSLANG